ncbi:MAG: Ig-like domain-containing protein [Prosthecobacter sp.]|uniref:Ig-like domain-containing protein n=1 Tax=Prosthecobacter sp. TaxID=1965333 RepID=UPI003BAF31E0
MKRENAILQLDDRRIRPGLRGLCALLLLGVGNLVKADSVSHAETDALLAEAARLAPAAEAVVLSVGAVSPAEYVTKGNWSAVIPWTPHIPTSAAMLPDGRLLTFASNQRTTFPDGPQFTYAAVWDPATGLFTEINNGRHDMFCGGLSFLQDGRLLVNGGNGINGTTALASLFDWRTNEWVPAQTMADGRWYNTSIALPNGEVLTAGGNGGANGNGTIEQWNASSGWRRMSGISWQTVANPPIANAIETNWHPFFLVAPDGRVAHFGPHQALNWITASGTGAMTATGASIPGTHYPKQGAWAMYAPGKVVVAGGLTAIDDGVVVNKAFTVDLNGATPVVAPTAPMANARSFSNSVMLPNGEVMVVGGNTSGQFFSDLGTVFTPEIWNPTTGQWRAVADMSVPRNYHSLAMLLPDGRVWSGGGGLSGDALTDHQDAQVFTPPQLFNADGPPAVRPVITAAPDRIGPASIFTVNASNGVQYFSAISMSAQTHSVDTGLRHVRFTHTNPSPGVYAVTAPPSINVLTPGYWMMFAVDANGVWSVSRIIQVTNSTLPVVTNPGQQSVTQNSAVSLPISASATGGTLSYTASGLPTGLAIDAVSGLISGTVTATPGTYRSTILVSAAGQVTSVSFNWIVLLPNLGSGQIMREYWTNINGATVASLTSNTFFPANPNGRDLQPSFDSPQNWDDSTGQRLRGFLYVPVTGQYQFFISSDDESSLKLSTDANPANAVEISSQPGYTPPQTWTWYPQQTSALITLQAGKRYYIEALMKDGTGDDHLSVGWKKPGDAAVSIIAGTYLSPYLPIENPVVAWNFDETSWNGTAGEVKSTAAGLVAIAGTASGGANTTSANPALSGNPGTGSSALFNGTTQSVLMPYSASLNPNDFTIAAWVRHDAALGTARCVLASRDESTATKKGYGLWVTPDGFWQLRTGEDTSGLKGGAITVGQWTHVAATFRTTSASGANLTGVRRLYLNGILVNEDTGTYMPNASKPFTVGAADSPGTAFFAGAVDEVTLHQAPLSQPDILALRDLRHATSIVPQNLSPQITNPGAQASLIGAVVSLPVTANDPENDPITFSATGLPSGLSISPGSGVISGSVTVAGTFNVTLTASDGISTPATSSFVWNVTAGLTLQPLAAAPKATGAALTFTAQSANGINTRYKWNFGDGTPETAWLTTTSIAHTYAGPGRYLVTLTATDDTGITITSTFYQAVYAALTTRKPAASSSIVYEDRATGNDRVWCVNPDNNSVTAFDVVTRARYAEITVGTAPRSLALAPDGRLWVTNVETGTISIINTSTRAVAATVTLAYGSRPFGIVFDPAGTAAWVTLESTGRVLKLNPSTGAQLASIDAGGPVRHLSISADSARVYASRFITPRVAGENTATPMLTGAGGQVVVIGTVALAVERTILLSPSTAADTSTSARGLPNYLGAAVISPDGLSAWVPSKQDNIQRGVLRDGQPLNHENSVRAIVSRIDLTAQTEHLPSRVDIDNAGMPSAAAYDPYGIYVFTALEASREVAILDAWSHQEITRFPAGRAPQGVITSPDGSTLYVQNFMDRTITVHDVRGITQGGNTAPVTTATLNAVTTEKLTAQVLKGKQLFYDAQDPRLALQQYISCAVCHNDAGHDGRVWDLTGFGEGLRNTITLKGHATHGMLHWTGNFDEVQDFEGQIRALAGGIGLMTDTQLNTGTRNQPLGDAKAGVSADLDALAAYVKSLTVNGNSPSRTSSGALTTAATAGQQVFRSQNCASCHSGVNFTNSALNVFANIGTIKPASGKRLGAALTGLDVPTLRGSWATGPYLHDGSAATLSDAITAHSGVTLTATDLSNLAAFVASIDDAPTTAPLPFTVALTTAATNVTTAFNVTVAFSSSASGFTLSDVVVTNGVASTFSGSGASYTFRVTPTAAGVVTVSVPASAATDSTSLGNSVSNLLSVTYTDTTPPTVALSTPATSVATPFVVTATFSENVSGLLAVEFAVTNGTVTALSSAGAVYSATVTPTAAGTVTVRLPAGMVQDASGNPNTISNLLTVTYAPVIVGQTVRIQAEDFDEGGEGVAYHDAEAINIGEYVSGLRYRTTGVDIEPSKDADGTPSIGWITAGEWLRYTTILPSGNYNFSVRVATSFAGPVPVRVLINGTLATTINVTDTGGFYSWKTFSATGLTVPASAVVRIEFPNGNLNFNWMEFVNTSSPPDTTPPAVTLATGSSSVSAPFTVSAAFSEAVTGVALTDFTVTNGVASALSGSGAAYSVTITPTANGAVTVAMPAGAAADAATNASLASNTLSVTYTVPVPAPTVLLSTASSNVTGAFTVNAVFSQSVTGVALNDFIITNGAASALSGSGATYSILVTPTAAGAVTVSVPANAATNATGGANTASNLLTTTYTPLDTTPPTVALTTPASSVTAPFVVTATFSETVTGVALNDFTLTNGVASALSGSGATYSVTITPTANGAVTVALPVGAAFDAASNASLASNALSVTYTAPLPAPTVLLSTASSTVMGAFTVNAFFSQTVTGVALNDFIITNGAASTLSGSGATYSILVTPTAAGAVTVRVPANAATTATGGANTASNLLTATYTPPDTTPPTVVLSTPASSVTAPFVVNATFSENVTGLLASEFTVTNGTVTALSSAGAAWAATITPTAAGNVTVRIPAGVAQDAAGNPNTVSNLITASYTPAVNTNGLTGDYYIGKNFEQFSFTRMESTVNYTWGTGSPDPRIPADGYSVRWHGYLIPRYTQTYTIIPVTDDGVRLWVNGQQVVNDWNNHGDTWNNGVIALQAGVAVPVVMEYYESTGGATARMLWESPGQTREVIPQSQWLVNAPAAPAASPNTIVLASIIPGTVGLPNNLATTNSDEDSASDLLEVALGTALTSGITRPGEGLQLVTRSNSSVDATLLRPSGQGTFTFKLESSSDLINWSPLVATPTVVAEGNGWERVTWPDLQALPGQSLARGIIRLRITQTNGGTTTSAPLGWQQTMLYSGTQTYGLNLNHEALFTGSVSSATANSVTLSEQASVASAMDPAQHYYLEIISGPQAGHRLDLQSITGVACLVADDSLNTTLSASAVAGLSGARVILRSHRTLGEVFNPTLFQGSSTAAGADQVLFHNSSDYITYWLYDLGGTRNWVLNGGTATSMNETLIPPGTGVMLQIASASPSALLSTGSVRTTPFARPLQAGYNLFANPWPLDASPAQTRMTSFPFLASTLLSASSQMQFWKGDGSAGVRGYLASWLLQMPGQPVPVWISMSSAATTSQNNAPLLRTGRATFIKMPQRASPSVWIIPSP